MTAEVTPRSTTELFRAPAVLGMAGAGALVVLHLRDPHESGSYGFCPFLAVTGHPCPGCGGLRAVNELTHGDIVGALSSNLLAIGLLALLTVAWAAWAVRRARGSDDRKPAVRDRTLVLVLVVALAFGVLRNTPWGAWLAP